MVKRKKKDHDFAVNAFRVVQEATGEELKTEFDAKDLGRKGRLKNGKANGKADT